MVTLDGRGDPLRSPADRGARHPRPLRVRLRLRTSGEWSQRAWDKSQSKRGMMDLLILMNS